MDPEVKKEITYIKNSIKGLGVRISALEDRKGGQKGQSVWERTQVLGAVEASLTALRARGQLHEGEENYAEHRRLKQKRDELMKGMTI